MDLIMERTRGMSLSPEEKEAHRKEELEKKAKGFRLKLLEDAARADQILAAVEGEPEENRDLLWSMIWETMVEGLMEDEDPFKYLDLLEKLPQAREKSSVLKEARAALSGAMKDKSKDRKKVLTREKKKLASFGISGTAVVPKISKKTEFSSEFGETVARFRKKLLEDIRAA